MTTPSYWIPENINPDNPQAAIDFSSQRQETNNSDDSNENSNENTFEEEDDDVNNGDQNQDKAKRKKRKQVKQACINCRKAHACCGEERPCRRCMQLGIAEQCRDVENKKRGRKRKVSEGENDMTQGSIHQFQFQFQYQPAKITTQSQLEPQRKIQKTTSPPSTQTPQFTTGAQIPFVSNMPATFANSAPFSAAQNTSPSSIPNSMSPPQLQPPAPMVLAPTANLYPSPQLSAIAPSYVPNNAPAPPSSFPALSQPPHLLYSGAPMLNLNITEEVLSEVKSLPSSAPQLLQSGAPVIMSKGMDPSVQFSQNGPNNGGHIQQVTAQYQVASNFAPAIQNGNGTDDPLKSSAANLARLLVNTISSVSNQFNPQQLMSSVNVAPEMAAMASRFRPTSPAPQLQSLFNSTSDASEPAKVTFAAATAEQPAIPIPSSNSASSGNNSSNEEVARLKAENEALKRQLAQLTDTTSRFTSNLLGIDPTDSIAVALSIEGGRIVAWNKIFRGAFKYDDEDLFKTVRCWKDLIHEDDWGKVFSTLVSCIRSKQESYMVNFNGRRKDGQLLSVRSNNLVSYDSETGRPLFSISFATVGNPRSEYKKDIE